MNPFELHGPAFLLFYLILSTNVIGAVVLLRRASESAGAPKIDLADPYLIAYLRGGESEAVRVALVSVIDRGLLVVNGTQIARATNAGPDSVRRLIERALMERCALPGEAASISNDPALKLACKEYQENLKRNRLLPDNSVTLARLARLLVALFILAGVGGTQVILALASGRTNFLYLIILMPVAIAVAAIVSFPRLTTVGATMLKDIQTLYAGLKERAAFIRPGGATIEAMMLAATYGVGALEGDAFAYTRTLFRRTQASATASSYVSTCSSSCGSSSGSASGSSSGSSCGSSCGGGCGGGCGGCGG